jgi:hypothetical protein
MEAIQEDIATGIVDCRKPVIIRIEYELLRHIPHSRFFLVLRNGRGEALFTTSDYDLISPAALIRSPGRYESSVSIPANLFKTGTIYGTVAADIKNERIVFTAEDALELDVIESNSDVVDTLSERHVREGIVAPLLEWTSRPLSDSQIEKAFTSERRT